MRRRPILSATTVIAVAAAGLVTPVSGAVTAWAEERTVTLVGSLQSELGCPGDWDPGCSATDLPLEASPAAYGKVFDVPKGSYELKVAINRSWDENYGADGAKGGANLPLVLEGPAKIRFTYDDETHQIGIAPVELSGPATDADAALATPSLRQAPTRERFYFVMADRFANGDPTNDEGGLTGDRLETGLDPSDKGFYHGGDLAGIADKLDYIKGLGTTAIWLTPSFKNRPVQGSGDDISAGYHGYWVTDFTQIDPHLGTNAEMKELIAAAHAKGMKVYFDIITNHTADVIDYEGDSDTYRAKDAYPYQDAEGDVFDDAKVAGTDDFPTLDPATSFPYVPTFRTPEDATVKVPDWLNDPVRYHNRGNSTFAGESSLYSDFFGLDDLFTEDPVVVKGMEDIYTAWVDLGIDGFRIDTVKHVNMPFWRSFGPTLMKHAKDAGNDDFFMFGEVFDGSPAYMSQYTTEGRLPATLDFGFQGAALGFASGKATTGLRDLFAGDDYYTDLDSNAYSLPTFLGNHDMGRVGMMLRQAKFGGDELLARTELANSLMFLTRGQPVVYYGDEQGFTGAGGDKEARQDLFATQVEEYQDDVIIDGGADEPMGSADRYGTDGPLYTHLSELAELRAAHPALADGAQLHRYASDSAGIYAVSRIDKDARREYVVVANNATEAKTATFATASPKTSFLPLLGASKGVTSDRAGRVTVTVPPLSVQVFRGKTAFHAPESAITVYPASPAPGAAVGGRAEIGAAMPGTAFAEVTFLQRPVGTTEWTPIGTDDNAPYRVFHDVRGLAKGTLLEYRMVARDIEGNLAATSTYGIVGDPKAGGGDGGSGGGSGPVVQPDHVSVPGNLNSEMGCAGDWDPACDQAQLTRNPNDDIWRLTTTLPAGDYEYKAAINKSWDENYGVGAVRNGSNIPLKADGTPVTFYYDHRTHWVTSDAQAEIITAPGSFQSELGCSGDWAPDCMRSWLQDPDGDGTYTWSSSAIPAGSYEFKVTHGLSWAVNYGAGGEQNGPNVAFSVPSDGTQVTISYVLGTHQISVKTSRAGTAPDLSKARAFVVAADLVAWPASAVPAGVDPATLTWRLHWSADGGLAVDAEAVTGGSVATLTRDPKGLPRDVLAAHPELKDAVALRTDKRTAALMPEILKGQVAVAMYDSTGVLLDATGAQTAIALDAIYAGAARKRAYGVAFPKGGVSFSVWAPTAQDVNLLTWPAGSDDLGLDRATRTDMVRAADGSWTARLGDGAKEARYLYEVKVFAPSTGKVETNRVTDPNSVALTLNSTRSVAVDLKDAKHMPAAWRTTPAPTVAQNVDTTIYELHVRDFSATDESVPEELRGSYLAFAEEGEGRKHLRTLAQAGLNTVHLLPTFDIASIEEDPAKQEQPDCDLESFAPDSEEQQKCTSAVAGKDAFNWGYDPYHWTAPEGSYASTAEAADGGARIAEFRTMVGALHEDGLRVVLDEVYNHTAESGQGARSVLDKVVPGYYHRLNATGAVETSTCCQNVATEHAMAEKMMVDSVVTWARDYKVDGFRFDLMGHHSKANMLAIRAALDALTTSKDGVDGKQIYLYGEGWNFGEVAGNKLFEQATQGQLGGTHIGTFSDRLRDAVRGGGPFDEDPRKQGFGSGLSTDPNGAPVNGDSTSAAARLAHETDLVQLGLAGNLRDFTFRSAATGEVVKGTDVDYNGSPAGYADQPDEVVTYVDAHDNETLFDALTYKLPVPTTMADRVRMNTLSLATTALSQTPSFWHAGADLLRSKSLNRDSYDSGDWFNELDWTGADNGFGHGLPPEGVNSAKWPYMRPLLADPALKPTQAEAQHASAMAQDLLELRFSTPLFRLGSADAIRQKVSFPVSGTADAHPGVVVMRIDDTVGADVDPALRGLVVVLNASPDAVAQKVPGLSGSWSLSPVQRDGADSVASSAAYDTASSTLTVPARTVAVFVQPS
ncbi:pullulanase-type alpha-1,6-glucosidase [Intrasporangium calvum]|uniref:Pullulanase-type alpha-1,6-glucosidase n=1 Tax=Intrasporangium calvum TaxID=53358 RepID=A0ABT5GLD9_9MICO|nr:pullulanase-type alpha-1,6-glucosidase [Intrasporangium calvum]MDC5699043.1 pullulanase-type alpha-1,6-glucosidase [Intrasporangium calvum]